MRGVPDKPCPPPEAAAARRAVAVIGTGTVVGAGRNRRRRRALEARFAVELVAGTEDEFALGLDDHEETPLALQLRVGMTGGSEQLDAAHLEILEVAAVVQVTHRIDFRVANAD